MKVISAALWLLLSVNRPAPLRRSDPSRLCHSALATPPNIGTACRTCRDEVFLPIRFICVPVYTILRPPPARKLSPGAVQYIQVKPTPLLACSNYGSRPYES